MVTMSKYKTLDLFVDIYQEVLSKKELIELDEYLKYDLAKELLNFEDKKKNNALKKLEVDNDVHDFKTEVIDNFKMYRGNRLPMNLVHNMYINFCIDKNIEPKTLIVFSKQFRKILEPNLWIVTQQKIKREDIRVESEYLNESTINKNMKEKSFKYRCIEYVGNDAT